jgi:hypothetical protein
MPSGVGTTVTYNGVELHNVQTKSWDQELVYDASGTDLLYSRYRMRFEGIVHAQNIGTGTHNAPAWIAKAGTTGSGANAVTTFAAVRSLLAQPRATLTVTFGSSVVVNVCSRSGDTGMPPGMAPGTDLDNGPKPRHVSLTHIIGDQVFRLVFEIDCCVQECPSASPGDTSLLNVVNNRWSISEAIDENFFTTRTIRGRLRLGRPMQNAHAYKSAVVPSLESGFRRDRIDFAVAENGLDCEYTVVDKQVHQAAPWPAARMIVDHAESTSDGVKSYGEVTVRMQGSPEADPRLMIAQAIRIVDYKLKLNIGGGNTNRGVNVDYMVESASITEHTGDENAVEVSMRVQHTGIAGVAGSDTMALYLQRMGQPIRHALVAPLPGTQIQYEVNKSRTPKIWGYDPWGSLDGRSPAAVLYALGCYLQSPCNSRHAIYDGEMPEGEMPDSTGPEYDTDVTVAQSNLPAYDPDRYSEETKTNIYTYARMDSRYFNLRCRTQMPVAGLAADSPSISGSDPVPLDTHTAVFDLARPQGRREVRVDFERAGTWPEIPEPEDTYTDGEIVGTLIRSWDRALPPTLSADKVQKIYRIEAYYLYALNRPVEKDEATRIGILPQANMTQDDNALTRQTVYTDRMKLGTNT